MTDTAPVPLKLPTLEQTLRLHVHASGDQVISPRIRQDGIWEPYETALTLALLGSGDVFVDVGANLGYFSVLAAARVGAGGAVFAFEPHPDNYALLRANIALNGFDEIIEPVCAGLADVAMPGTLFVSDDNLGDHQIYAGTESRNSLGIDLVRGTDFLRSAGVERVDLLKVDTQGSESQVIRGLLPLLLELPEPAHILIELTPHSLREAGSSGRELVELLAALQQPLWIVDHVHHSLIAASAEELAIWCDNWDAVPESQGFVNVLVGEAPAEVAAVS